MVNQDGAVRVLLVFESSVAGFASQVAAGLREAGTSIRTGPVDAIDPSAATYCDLIVFGAPAASLARRHLEGGIPGVASARGRASLRGWLGAVPSAMRHRHETDDLPIRIAGFDVSVRGTRRRGRTAANRATRALTSHGFGLGGLPTTFLIDPILHAPGDGELERAKLWGEILGVAACQPADNPRSRWGRGRADREMCTV